MTIDFLAGCIGGAAGVIVGHPLDTVKVRIQTQSIDNIKYKGTFQSLFKIAKQESIQGLYKGISSPLYGVSLVNALVFGVYGSLRPFVIGSPGNNTPTAHALAGAAAGAAQSIVCSPMELVKIRMQINESTSVKHNTWHILRSIYRNEGGLIRGVYKGYFFTLSREIPGFASYFASYEIFINGFLKYGLFLNGAGQVGVLGMMISGGFAGAVSWIACLPQDIFKTRYQSDVQKQYTGLWDCMRKTCKVEGYQAFTRPLPSILIRAFPMNAITLSVANLIIRFSDSRMDNLGTSHHEIYNLLEELNVTGTETQENLYNCLHTPHYRLLRPNFYFQPLGSNSLLSRQLYISAIIANDISATTNHFMGVIPDNRNESHLSPHESNAQKVETMCEFCCSFSENNWTSPDNHIMNDCHESEYKQLESDLISKPRNSGKSHWLTILIKDWILSHVNECKRPEKCVCPNCLSG